VESVISCLYNFVYNLDKLIEDWLNDSDAELHDDDDDDYEVNV